MFLVLKSVPVLDFIILLSIICGGNSVIFFFYCGLLQYCLLLIKNVINFIWYSNSIALFSAKKIQNIGKYFLKNIVKEIAFNHCKVSVRITNYCFLKNLKPKFEIWKFENYCSKTRLLKWRFLFKPYCVPYKLIKKLTIFIYI